MIFPFNLLISLEILYYVLHSNNNDIDLLLDSFNVYVECLTIKDIDSLTTNYNSFIFLIIVFCYCILFCVKGMNIF